MKKPKRNYHEHDTPKPGQLPETSSVASANECTGLMYKTPESGEEWEALQELSPMAIPKKKVPQEGFETISREDVPRQK